MAAAVDGIADVVHIACDLRQLDVVFRAAELFQDVGRRLCHPDAMGLGVVGVAQQPQVLVAFFQQLVDFFVVSDIFIGHTVLPSVHDVFREMLPV